MEQLTSFLLWCSGTDKTLIYHPDCPKFERTKQAGLGALVLIPSVLSFISMSYAISTFVNQPFYYISLGFIWACIVFVIDRYIVSTFRKKKPIDEESKIFFLEKITNNIISSDFLTFTFWVRIIFAVFLGIIIAHPLVMRYFDDSIQEKLHKINSAKIDTIKIQFENKISKLEKDSIRLVDELKKYQTKIDNQQQLLADEIRGEYKGKYSDSSGIHLAITGVRGYGPAAKKDEEILNALINEKLILEKKHSEIFKKINNEIKQLRAKSDTSIIDLKNKLSNDYLARELAFSQLLKEEEAQGSSIVWWTQWLIILFFVFVDILPVTFKVFTKFGKYDELVHHYSLLDDTILYAEYKELDEDSLRNSVKLKALKGYYKIIEKEIDFLNAEIKNPKLEIEELKDKFEELLDKLSHKRGSLKIFLQKLKKHCLDWLSKKLFVPNSLWGVSVGGGFFILMLLVEGQKMLSLWDAIIDWITIPILAIFFAISLVAIFLNKKF